VFQYLDKQKQLILLHFSAPFPVYKLIVSHYNIKVNL